MQTGERFPEENDDGSSMAYQTQTGVPMSKKCTGLLLYLNMDAA
jgi:hypothetical protein